MEERNKAVVIKCPKCNFEDTRDKYAFRLLAFIFCYCAGNYLLYLGWQ